MRGVENFDILYNNFYHSPIIVQATYNQLVNIFLIS
jgi:hypothetical protein